MGSAMATRLVNAGMDVTVWNRTKDRCSPVIAKGAKIAENPKDVVDSCDLIFACTSDPVSARQVFFGENGVLAGMRKGKKFVDMSTVDEDTAIDIGKAVKAKGGMFLEAPVSGSKGPAINGQLVILAGGDEELVADAQPCFDIMGKKTFYLGEVGAGARMKLVVNMIMGVNIVALSEGLAVGQKAGLRGNDILDVLEEGALKSPMYSLKGPTMLAGNFEPNFPLKHQQKDVGLAVDLGQKVGQSLPVAAAANEVFKSSMAEGRADVDMAAVYLTVKR